jgi:hypothetical protein
VREGVRVYLLGLRFKHIIFNNGGLEDKCAWNAEIWKAYAADQTRALQTVARGPGAARRTILSGPGTWLINVFKN